MIFVKFFDFDSYEKRHQRVPAGRLYIRKIKIISLRALKWVGIAKKKFLKAVESILQYLLHVFYSSRDLPDF